MRSSICEYEGSQGECCKPCNIQKGGVSVSEKITVHYVGTDYWSRAVFQGDNGHFYKTADILDPDGGFLNAPREEQERIFSDLHTSEPFNDAEPGWPVTLENFILANSRANS